MRLAKDFNPDVLEAFRTVQDEVSALHGEARVQGSPMWRRTDMGDTRHLSAVWFLPVDGVMTNHCLTVEEYGRGPVGSAPEVRRRWTVAGTCHRGPVLAQELIVVAPPGLQIIRHAASMVGLLPAHVPPPTYHQVTRPGDLAGVYIEGLPALPVGVADLDAARRRRADEATAHLHPRY